MSGVERLVGHSEGPISLGYHGLAIIHSDDELLYAKVGDISAIRVQCLQIITTPEKISVKIKLLEDYISEKTGLPYVAGETRDVQPEELYWNRNTDLPADRLETLLNMLGQRTGKGIVFTL